MSIFKDRAIVLKIEKMPENVLLYTFFTYNYGKIRANKKFSKTEKNLDLGYLVDFEIVTKENVSIHKIKNIKIKSEFNLKNNNSFAEINLFLEILSFVLNETLDGVENKEIFSVIEQILKTEKVDETKLILAKLKLKAIFGNLDVFHENKTIEKILKFVFNSKINDILKLSGITKDLVEKLKEC